MTNKLIDKKRICFCLIISVKCIFVDKEAPVCPHNQTLNTQPGQPFAVWQGPSVTDNSGDVPGVTCDPQSESNFTIGQTLVTCEAVDSSGNINTCRFQVRVVVEGSCFLILRCLPLDP